MAEDNNGYMDNNILSFTDEDGNVVEMELLKMLDYDGETYAFLLPTDDESDGVYIMRYSEEEDGDSAFFDIVEDEELSDTLFEIFKEESGDLYDFE